MRFGIVADVTDYTMGIVELARAVESAGLESLFLTQHTHVPTSRSDLLELPDKVGTEEVSLAARMTGNPVGRQFPRRCDFHASADGARSRCRVHLDAQQ